MAKDIIKVAELFAGVGGFRLGLEGYHNPNHPEFSMDAAGPFKTIWANQWEPPGTESKQFAWRCYEAHFGKGSCVNENISTVLDEYEKGKRDIPDFNMLVGGFPCQDYSVAKPLGKARGIEGKKGALWWDILRLIRIKNPKYILLENVDRLLKNPVGQRGRDFAVILSTLAREGYSVEWRVINAADYGMPQKRRRVYIYGECTDACWDMQARLEGKGIITRAFPITAQNTKTTAIDISASPYEISQQFGINEMSSPFQNSGVMQNGQVLTQRTEPLYRGDFTTLSSIIVSDSKVPKQFFIKDEELPKWEKQRAAKKQSRVAANGFKYTYAEGAMAWPDPLDKPARTILTGEGGRGASRTKHAIRGDSGQIRRLIPEELEKIQMFPTGWTSTGMTDGQRAFCMGNALVTEIPHKIGIEISRGTEY